MFSITQEKKNGALGIASNKGGLNNGDNQSV